jgi:hypothetical protein
MTAKETEAFYRTREHCWVRSAGICEADGCAEPLDYTGFQLAHRIPQRKHFLRKYGKDVIHHRFNVRAVCSERCNAAVSIAQQPEEIEELVRQIRADLQQA